MTMTSADYKKGEHYIEADDTIKQMPPVVVFFSFLDRTSRDWAVKHQIAGTIRRHIPQGTQVARYHTSNPYAKEFGDDLTESWAIASRLQVDDKVIGPLFEAIHGETKVTDMAGVKAVFDYIGIPPMKFDREYPQQTIRKEAAWMDECAQRLNIKTIPAIVVRGKYIVKTDPLGEELDADKVAEVVKYLLAL